MRKGEAATGRIGSGMKKSVPPRPPKEVGFSQRRSRLEKTTCDGRRSSNAEDLKPSLADAGGHWRNISSEFPALESKWAKLFNLSRSVTSTGPVLFKRPARYTSASSMAIERFNLATALPSMARSVLRCSLGPRSEAVSTTRMATCHLSRPWSREVAWGRQCDCIHSAGGHIAGGVGYDLRHSTEGRPSGV